MAIALKLSRISFQQRPLSVLRQGGKYSFNPFVAVLSDDDLAKYLTTTHQNRSTKIRLRSPSSSNFLPLNAGQLRLDIWAFVIRAIHLTQPRPTGCGLISDVKITGSTSTACWIKR
jgi:hypothetical protein